MSHQDHYFSLLTPSSTLIRRMITTGLINLVIISVFLSGVNNADPEWGQYWMVRPLVIVPLAGAFAGLFYHVMDHLQKANIVGRTISILASLIMFIIALWLGTVLGLDGTLWN